ncbi:MAG: PspC domain-containing protein [Burkholderiales bacterium]|nr:PspC domain-containing protein [Burkholderiales bacterium]
MGIPDELARLDELHQRGALTDDEFTRAKARVLNGTAGTGPAAINTLRRSVADRWLGGVCGGLADYTGVAAWVWRLAFALMVMCAGTGVLAYVLLWIFVPEQPSSLERPALHSP